MVSEAGNGGFSILASEIWVPPPMDSQNLDASPHKDWQNLGPPPPINF